MTAPLTAILAQIAAPDVPAGVADRIESIGRDVKAVQERLNELGELVGRGPGPELTRLGIFHGYVAIFFIAFIVALLATPIMRRLALANGIIDRPSEARKAHRIPVAYLGGVAVFLGIMAGIFFSYISTFNYTASNTGIITFHPTQYLEDGLPHAVPVSIVFGMFVIMMVGLLDDIMGIPPRIKIGGQLVAAAALAASDVGVKVAAGIIVPFAKGLGLHTTLINDSETLFFSIPLPLDSLGIGITHIPIDVVYWTGTLIIALFVLGACNASNLIDGLDGLLTGTTAIAAGGLLVIALTLALQDHGPRDGPRIVLCLSVLGACLGFLPHNFNPATIFLGDCGSLLLGFATIVIILMLGDRGQTHLVFAGLIIYAIPIIDTILAIIRRKMAGKSISDADDQHLHHMLKRALGVKGAVFALYGIGAGFAGLGIAMSLGRARVVYAIALVFAAFIVVTAIKIARKKQLDDQAAHYASSRAPQPRYTSSPAAKVVQKVPPA